MRVEQLTKRGFVRFIRQNLKKVKIGLPGALCKGGEAKQHSHAALQNKERAT